MVLDPCSLNAGVEIITHLALVVTVELATQEGCDILRFHGVNSGSHDLIIQDAKL